MSSTVQGSESVGAQETKMATALGTRLKEIRENLGLSRSEVARRANIDPAQLHRLENSDNAAPTFRVVVRLSRALGVSLSWLAMAEDSDIKSNAAALPFEADDEVRQALVTASESLQEAIAKMYSEPLGSE